MFLVPGEVGGSEPLLTNLVREIAKTEHEIFVFAVKGFRQAYPDIDATTTVIEVPWRSGAQGLRILSEHTWLLGKARSLQLDLLHHGVGTVPFFRTLPTTVTVHDIQYKHHPENFVTPKRWWLNLNLPFAIMRSSAVTVPSAWVKTDISQAFNVSGDHIHVVRFGSENLFPETRPSVDELREKFHLERDYFLFPGRTYPHKNHLLLLEAFAPLASNADLVLTGPPWFRDRVIEAAASELSITDSVRQLSLVTRGELAALYSGAVALTYPSKFEGFGAPVLEAMTLGCPVIASNICAIPEVAGEAAILLDPDNAELWTRSMSDILDDKSKRAAVVKKGGERAKSFTWKKSAEDQIAAYEWALA